MTVVPGRTSGRNGIIPVLVFHVSPIGERYVEHLPADRIAIVIRPPKSGQIPFARLSGFLLRRSVGFRPKCGSGFFKRREPVTRAGTGRRPER